MDQNAVLENLVFAHFLVLIMADQKPESAVAVAEAPQSAAGAKTLLETAYTPRVNETDQDGHLTVPVADEKDDTEKAPRLPPPSKKAVLTAG